MQNKITIGNFSKDCQNHRGWVVGHFLDNLSPLKTQDLEIKWNKQAKGEKDTNYTVNKTAKSLHIQIRGNVEFYFENQRVVLDKEGDYVFWDHGVPHRWKILEDSLSIVIRWPSIPEDQVKLA